MKHRLDFDDMPTLKSFGFGFSDLSFLMVAFFLIAGSWTALGGHLHASLPKEMSGGC